MIIQIGQTSTLPTSAGGGLAVTVAYGDLAQPGRSPICNLHADPIYISFHLISHYLSISNNKQMYQYVFAFFFLAIFSIGGALWSSWWPRSAPLQPMLASTPMAEQAH